MKEMEEIENNEIKQRKIKEIIKDTDEKISLFTKKVLNPLEEIPVEKEQSKKLNSE